VYNELYTNMKRGLNAAYKATRRASGCSCLQHKLTIHVPPWRGLVALARVPRGVIRPDGFRSIWFSHPRKRRGRAVLDPISRCVHICYWHASLAGFSAAGKALAAPAAEVCELGGLPAQALDFVKLLPPHGMAGLALRRTHGPQLHWHGPGKAFYRLIAAELRRSSEDPGTD
jgi:hypothetical protein